MAFVDFDNIAIPAKRFHSLNYIDFNKFRNILLRGYRGVGCTVYLPHKMGNLLPVIQKSGLNVTVVSPGKSVDGRLIFDLLINAYHDKFDVAIIAGGDRDYRPVIEEVKSMGKEVIVASFSRNLAHAIRSVADDIIDLDTVTADIAAQIYTYTCQNPECGKSFKTPRRLNRSKALCPDCYKESKSKS